MNASGGSKNGQWMENPGGALQTSSIDINRIWSFQQKKKVSKKEKVLITRITLQVISGYVTLDYIIIMIIIN